ncbi:proline dehydrogenase [Colletotrichum truncatum]|uniref:Proline dehydrogenase n=1 Tax=Colletotrichum truncatum TaxID=5467 RepID=A0ACC3ZFV8_COLTU
MIRCLAHIVRTSKDLNFILAQKQHVLEPIETQSQIVKELCPGTPVADGDNRCWAKTKPTGSAATSRRDVPRLTGDFGSEK